MNVSEPVPERPARRFETKPSRRGTGSWQGRPSILSSFCMADYRTGDSGDAGEISKNTHAVATRGNNPAARNAGA
jgi:hypothetical protein